LLANCHRRPTEAVVALIDGLSRLSITTMQATHGCARWGAACPWKRRLVAQESHPKTRGRERSSQQWPSRRPCHACISHFVPSCRRRLRPTPKPWWRPKLNLVISPEAAPSRQACDTAATGLPQSQTCPRAKHLPERNPQRRPRLSPFPLPTFKLKLEGTAADRQG
jgi:hypothetical protein